MNKYICVEQYTETVFKTDKQEMYKNSCDVEVQVIQL